MTTQAPAAPAVLLRRASPLWLAMTTSVLVGCAQTPPALPTTIASASELAQWRNARFVLLGEVHDNAEQHRQRAALLGALLADGKPTRVLFEQMDRENDPAIAAALPAARAAQPPDAEAIATAGRLDRQAWQWPLHRPLIEAALAGGAGVGGANLSRDAGRAVVRGGFAAAPADLQPLLSQPGWTAALQAALEKQIDSGHCGALPASQFAPMALAQRARDAAMARAMLAAPAGSRVVLIAGNGHVRTDMAVPKVLRDAGVPAAQIVAIGFLEIGDPPVPVDVARYTPAAQRGDPCAAFRR